MMTLTECLKPYADDPEAIAAELVTLAKEAIHNECWFRRYHGRELYERIDVKDTIFKPSGRRLYERINELFELHDPAPPVEDEDGYWTEELQNEYAAWNDASMHFSDGIVRAIDDALQVVA